MSHYDDIRAALEVHLSGTPSLPAVAWENKGYKPTTGQPFIKARFIPVDRRPAVRGLNPQHKYTGLFQLLLCYPEGEGPGPSQDMVDALIDRFQSTTHITFTNDNSETIVVDIDRSEQRGAYDDSPWYKTPVNIYWYAYK